MKTDRNSEEVKINRSIRRNLKELKDVVSEIPEQGFDITNKENYDMLYAIIVKSDMLRSFAMDAEIHYGWK